MSNNMENKEMDAHQQASIESLLSEKFAYLKKRWWLFIVVCIAFGAIGFIYASLQQPQYKSRMTFALDDGSTSESSISSIASQFGLSLGSGNNIFEGDNIIEIMKSRRMIENVLLSVDTFDNRSYRMIEYFMNAKGRNSFNPKIANVHFPAFQNRSSFTYLQDSVLKLMYEKMLLENINVEKPDRKYNIFEINISSPSEKFSKDMTDRLVNEANIFYTELKTKKSRATLDALENRISSVKEGLYSSISSRAGVKDANLNPVFEASQVPVLKQHTNIELYSAAYAEMFKNLELARFQYLINTPILQIIDHADYPMQRIKMSRLKTALMLALLSAVFLAVWLLIKEQRERYKKMNIAG